MPVFGPDWVARVRQPGGQIRLTLDEWLTLLRRATVRSAKNAANTMPISTASIRSKHTVTSAVSTNVTASDLVDRRIFRTVPAEIIRNEVTISTADSAASGIVATGPLAR